MTRSIKVFLLFLTLLTMASNEVLAQCAMCRATLENNVSSGDTSVATGLNFGILYLFVVPYLLFMVLAYSWYKKSRQHKKSIRISRHL